MKRRAGALDAASIKSSSRKTLDCRHHNLRAIYLSYSILESLATMPPKDKPSKKAVKEKQNKAIDEATFGIKNKNKSKKVQQFISRVEKSVKRSGPGLEIVSCVILSFMPKMTT